jgi:ATP-dependent Clp protease protease subunit
MPASPSAPEPRDPLDDEGVIRLFGPVDAASASAAIEAILDHNLRPRRPFLRLWVHSPGGEVDAGFALLDLMRWSRLPIHTTGLGLVASMGLLVLMAGAPGHRTLMPRTSVLSHRFQAGSAGSHADLVAQRCQQDLVHQRIVDHYAACTGLADPARIEAELLRPTDRWLTPEEAVALGLADRVWAPPTSGAPTAAERQAEVAP